jgi:hypothetical protein
MSVDHHPKFGQSRDHVNIVNSSVWCSFHDFV